MLGTPIWPNMQVPGPRLKNPSAIPVKMLLITWTIMDINFFLLLSLGPQRNSPSSDTSYAMEVWQIIINNCLLQSLHHILFVVAWKTYGILYFLLQLSVQQIPQELPANFVTVL